MSQIYQGGRPWLRTLEEQSRIGVSGILFGFEPPLGKGFHLDSLVILVCLFICTVGVVKIKGKWQALSDRNGRTTCMVHVCAV